jgi:hypothetical protein
MQRLGPVKEESKYGPGSVRLQFFFASGKLILKEQYVIYNYNSMIADIGGYLGLLMGYSLLSVYEMAVDWFDKICPIKISVV